MEFHAVDEVGVVGEFFEYLKFCFDGDAGLGIFDGDNFWNELFFGVLEIVCPDDDWKRALTDYLLWCDDIGGILKLFDLDFLSHWFFDEIIPSDSGFI